MRLQLRVASLFLTLASRGLASSFFSSTEGVAGAIVGALGHVDGQSADNGPIPLRRSITELAAEAGPQWDLYLQALRAMYDRDPKDPESFFQIAGIHGRPFTEYNNAGKMNTNGWGGYSTHGEILFLIWHRPLVALFEQTLVKEAKTLAARYPDHLRPIYQRAAEDLRAPYWDWALEPWLPSVVLPQTIEVKAATKTGTVAKKIDNPLYTYRFSKEVMQGKYGEFNTYDRMYRCPNPQDANQKLYNRHFKSWLYYVFSRAKSFSEFATTASKGSSLEAVHNAVHWDAGCGGQFLDSQYAAFEPLFMLHHSNIDRLWAYWQAIHPEASTFNGAYQGRARFNTLSGTMIGLDSPLQPFRQANGEWHTSRSVNSIKTFGYAYQGVEYWAKSETEMKQSVVEIINSLYGPKEKQRPSSSSTSPKSTQTSSKQSGQTSSSKQSIQTTSAESTQITSTQSTQMSSSKQSIQINSTQSTQTTMKQPSQTTLKQSTQTTSSKQSIQINSTQSTQTTMKQPSQTTLKQSTQTTSSKQSIHINSTQSTQTTMKQLSQTTLTQSTQTTSSKQSIQINSTQSTQTTMKQPSQTTLKQSTQTTSSKQSIQINSTQSTQTTMKQPSQTTLKQLTQTISSKQSTQPASEQSTQSSAQASSQPALTISSNSSSSSSSSQFTEAVSKQSTQASGTVSTKTSNQHSMETSSVQSTQSPIEQTSSSLLSPPLQSTETADNRTTSAWPTAEASRPAPVSSSSRAGNETSVASSATSAAPPTTSANKVDSQSNSNGTKPGEYKRFYAGITVNVAHLPVRPCAIEISINTWRAGDMAIMQMPEKGILYDSISLSDAIADANLGDVADDEVLSQVMSRLHVVLRKADGSSIDVTQISGLRVDIEEADVVTATSKFELPQMVKSSTHVLLDKPVSGCAAQYKLIMADPKLA